MNERPRLDGPKSSRLSGCGRSQTLPLTRSPLTGTHRISAEHLWHPPPTGTPPRAAPLTLARSRTVTALSDPRRLFGNLLQLGAVESVDLAHATCRVRVGDLVTGDLPWLTPRADATRVWSPPLAGEQVLLLCPSTTPSFRVISENLRNRSFPSWEGLSVVSFGRNQHRCSATILGDFGGTTSSAWGHRMLTDLACGKAAPKDKPYKLGDAGGLYLYVLQSGFKSWRWKYRVGGKEKRLVFGGYPEISLSKARELREDAARTLREGADPAVAKRQRAAEQTAMAGSTFETIAREWHASQKAGWSKRYANIVLNSFVNDVFPRIGTLPITAVTTPLVLEVLRPIEARGAVETAHRVRQRISEVFARAIAAGIALANPSAVTKRALGRKTKSKFPAVRTIKLAQAVLAGSERQPGHPLGARRVARHLGPLAYREQLLLACEPEAPAKRLAAGRRDEQVQPALVGDLVGGRARPRGFHRGVRQHMTIRTRGAARCTTSTRRSAAIETCRRPRSMP